MLETGTAPLLFERFPGLSGNLAWRPLGSFPTPLERLGRDGGRDLWVKRDDLSSPLYGGNKVRKLEFALADAQQRHRTRVVTFGGLGTNHGLATAVFCRQLGLDCTLLLFRQPVTAAVRQNLRLFQAYGADTQFTGGLGATLLGFYLTRRLRHPRAYFLPAGGSNPLGTLGFVNAAFELQAQVDAGEMPVPAVIFCPAGSNGTLAGLALGVQLAGLPTQVVGVRVSLARYGPFDNCTPAAVARLMRRTAACLQRCGAALPRLAIQPPVLLDGYLGDGYGHPTTAGRQAAAVAAARGLRLEATYTAKTFAAVLDHCRGGAGAGGPMLFWHTYNAVDLQARERSVALGELDAPLRRFVSGNPPPRCKAAEEPLTAGCPAPDFTYDSPEGNQRRFHARLGPGRTLLFFLRYAGCPLCQMRFATLARGSCDLLCAGLKVCVVLPGTSTPSIEAAAARALPFEIVCDPRRSIFARYGVMPGPLRGYAAPAVLRRAAAAHRRGFRHGAREGDERQLPAVFVVNPDATIEYAYYGRHIDDLPDLEVLLDLAAPPAAAEAPASCDSGG